MSSSYAPPGQSLASVTLVGCPLEEPEEQDVQAGKVGTTASSSSASDAVLEKEVRAQLREWWGAAVVDKWRLLRIYRYTYSVSRSFLLAVLCIKTIVT